MRLAEAYVEIIGKDGLLKTALNRSRAGLQRLGRYTQRISRASRRALIAMVAGITAAGVAMAKFERQMNSVSTMLDSRTMPLMGQFERGIKQMSVEFGEGTGTLAKGLYDILSASIPAEKAMKVLRTSVIAATAGMTTTAVAGDTITTILNSYAMSADKAGAVSDILFAIVKRGKTTFGELGAVIGNAASTAAIAGLSLEEFGASIATMTRAGLKTPEAITAVNSMLRAFLRPTTDAIAKAKEFGFELNTSTLRAGGLSDVLDKLRKASAEEIAVLFPMIRGLKGVAAALKNMEGFGIDVNMMLNAGGKTMEAYRKMAKGLSFQFGRLTQAGTLLAEAFGQVLFGAERGAAALAEIVEKVVALTKWLRKLSPDLKKVITFLVKWTAIALLAAASMSVIAFALAGFAVALLALPIVAAITALGLFVDNLIRSENSLWSLIGGLRIRGATIRT